MDKRLKGDGKERTVLIRLPAALHRKVKALAVETDKTLDDVVVGILGKSFDGVCNRR